MRELRVEDALLYLDQVKVEFGDRPHIYNEFLDIMKTFKTQQIDTPGVIRRVSNLFQGNRRLVLGFNTFLPEGYKIEIDGEGPPVAVYRAPGSDVVHVLRESAESQAVSVSAAALAAGPGGTGLAYPRVDQMGARLPPQEQQILYRVGGGGPQQPQQQQLNDGGMGGSPPNNNGGGMREMSQQTIKSMLPHDAGGVAPRPQQLQQQQQPPPQQQQYHQQLPGGVAPRQPMSPQKPPPKRTGMPQQQQQQQQRGLNGQPMPPQQQHSPSQQMQQQRAAPTGFAIPLQDAAPGQPPLEFDHAINYVTTIKRRFSSEPETYKKFLEILHTYQKEQRGIKEVLDEVSELFEDHPDLLKEFTFFLPDAVQAQAKAQLDQVAKESEARKRVKAKAAIMNTAQDMQRQAQTMRIQAAAARPPLPPTIHNDTMAAPSGGIAYPQPARSSIERENNISRGAQYGVVMFEPVRPPRKNAITAAVAALKNGRPTSIPELPTLANTTEAAFFERAKIHLNRRELAADKPAGSRRHTPYAEFLKCLHLFGAGILNKEELLMLLKHLFLQGHAPKTGVNATGGNHNPLVAHDASELMHDFEEILVGRGPFAAQQRALKDKSHYGSLRTRDFDFAGCENPTPSYRTFPTDYPQSLFLSNPGQSSMDASFLNKKLVCVDANVVVSGESSKRTRQAEQHHRKRKVLSMEESDGSKKRHNVYEEALTRIEEERYEIDMAIERNVHALRRIEPFAKEVQALREQEEKEGQPIGRLRYQLHRHSLNTIHINAIARIYGDRGDEILQHLLRNPLVVLPIVYQRLKQKDVEWRKVKVELTDRWNAATVANYEGSMDVQCYPNRKALEKAFTATRLLDECKRARSYVKHPEKVKSHKVTRLFQPTFAKRASDPGAVLFQPFIETTHCKVNISHKHAFQLMTHKIKESPNVSAYARERMGRIWAEFVAPWFQYPTHWVLPEVRESFGGELSPNVTKFAAGQRVVTIFGEGTVASFMDATAASGPRYRVKLPFGLGQLSPSAIVYAVPSKESPCIRRDGVMVRDESSLDIEGSGAKLSSHYQLLFGTEKVYLFLRMYTLVCSVLSDTREHCLAFPPASDPAESYVSPSRKSEPKKASPRFDFSSVLVALEKVLSGKMLARDFETLGRKVSKEKVHQIAALPRLIERCVDTMLKMAEEDTILNLYDYCQYGGGVDPVALRTQCLSVVPDASYRIQFDSSAGVISYCYIESGSSLVTAAQDEDDANEMMEDDTNMDTGDDDLLEDEDTAMEGATDLYQDAERHNQNGDAEPEVKRARLE